MFYGTQPPVTKPSTIPFRDSASKERAMMDHTRFARSRFHIFAMALLAALFGSACDYVQATNPYDPDTPLTEQAPAQVLGKVRLENQSFHGNIRVTITNEKSETFAVTDSDGNFRLTDITPGNYQLDYEYVAEDLFKPFSIEAVSITLDQTAVLSTVELEAKKGGLTGAALLQDRNDHTGINVFLERKAKGVSARILALETDGDGGETDDEGESGSSDGVVFEYSEQTGADGGYEFRGIAVGTYNVTIYKDDYVPASLSEVIITEDKVVVSSSVTLLPSSGALTINNPGDEFTNSREVALNVVVANNAAEMRVSESPDFADTEWMGFSLQAPFTLSEGDGLKTVYLQIKNDRGELSDVSSDSIILDTTPATVDLVSVNGGVPYTNQNQVTVSVSARDRHSGVADMRVGFAASADDLPWVDYNLEYVLPVDTQAQGTQSGWVQFRDGAGNLTDARAISILYDSQGPAVATPAIVIDDGASVTSNSAVRLDFNVEDADEMQVSNLGGMEDAAWETFRHSVNAWPLTDGEGERTVYARFRDFAGNATDILQASITVDTTGEIVGSVRIVQSSDYSDVRFTLDGTPVTPASLSDESGAFVLDDLPVGVYNRLTVSKPGFGKAEALVVEVQPGEQADVGEMVLYDENGSIAADIRIVGEGDIANLTVMLGGTALSDYELTETDTGWRFTTTAAVGAYPGMRFGMADFSEWSVGYVDVRPGQTVELGAVTLSSLYGTVAGTIELEGGSGYDDVTVKLGGTLIADPGIHADTGAFSFRAGVGTYPALTVAKPDFGSDSASFIEVKSAEETPVGALRLVNRYGSISAVLFLESASDAFDGFEVYLGGELRTDYTLDVQTAGEAKFGVFNMAKVGTGMYTGATFKVAGYGDAVLAPFEVEPAADADLGDVRLSRARGAIEGYVNLQGRSDNSGVIVTLVGTNVIAASDYYGYFVRENILAGTYNLEIKREGFQTVRRANVQILEGRTTTLSTVSAPIPLYPKEGDFTINGGDAYTNSRNVTLALEYTGAAKVRASESDVFLLDPQSPTPDWVDFTGGGGTMDYAFELSGDDGLKIIYVQFQSADGVNSEVFTGYITLDTQPPENGVVTIDDGNTYSKNSAGFVSLDLFAEDENGVASVRISNDGGVTFTEMSYRLTTTHIVADPAIDEEKTVSVRFIDEAGNESHLVSDSIEMDRTPPDVTSFRVGGCQPSDTCLVNSPVIQLEMAQSDVTQMKVAIGSPEFDGLLWRSVSSAASPFTWFESLPLVDGVYEIYLLVQDRAGNVLGGSAGGEIMTRAQLDRTPPEAPAFTIAEGSVTGQTGVNLQFGNPGAGFEVEISESAAFGASLRQPTAGAIAFTIEDSDGVHTIYARYFDEAGNASAVAGRSITLDTEAPGDLYFACDEAPLTNERQVDCTLLATGATHMSLHESADCAVTNWETFANRKAYTLVGDEGDIWISAHFKDGAGNESACVKQRITLDETPPSGASVVVNGGATHTKSTLVELTLSATDENGVPYMRLTNAVAFSGEPLEAFSGTRSWTLGGTNGAKSILVEFIDGAGNPQQQTGQITLDTIAPNGVTISLANGAAYTSSREIDVSIGASDNLTNDADLEYALSQDPGFNDAVWTSYGTRLDTTFELSGDDGQKTVYVRFRDQAGNLADALDTIVLDTQGPDSPTFYISESPYAPARAIHLEVESRGATEIFIGGDVIDDENTNEWIAIQPSIAVELDESDGEKTVTALFRDSALNEFGPVSRGTVLDTTPPDGSIAVGSSEYTRTREVQLALSATDDNGVTHMRLTDAAEFTTETWETFLSSRAWMLSSGSGMKTVRVQYRDAAGHSREFSDAITLDQIAPNDVELSVVGGGAYTETTDIGLEITASDNLTLDTDLTFRLSEDPSFEGAALQNYTGDPTAASFTLSSDDGPKIIYLRVYDQSGNIASAQASITLDTHTPTGSLSIAASDPTNDRNLALYLTASADVTQMAIVRGSATACPDWPDPASWQDYSPTAAHQLPDISGLYELKACLRDDAGNVGAAYDSINLDVDVPSAIDVQIAEGDIINTIQVTLRLSADGDVTRMAIANAGSLDCATAGYMSFLASYPWVLTPGSGSKSVSVCFKDSAGNTAADTITVQVDLDAPDSATVTIDGGDTTTGHSVDLTLSAPGDVEFMKIANGANIDCSSGVTTPYTGAVSGWRLNEGDGLRYVSACFKDRAGNLSSDSDSIMVDGTAPEGSIFIGGPDPTNERSLTITASASADVTRIAFVLGSATACPSWPNEAVWQEYQTTLGYLLPDASDAYIVKACFRDDAGNIGTAIDAVTLDVDPPTALSIAVVEGDLVNDAKVNLSLSADMDVNRMSIVNADSLDCATASYIPFGSGYSLTLRSESAIQTISGCFKDAAGNTGAASTQVTVDLDPPDSATVSIDQGNLTNSSTVDLTLTAPGDVTLMKVANGASIDCSSGVATPYAASVSGWNLNEGDGTRYVSVCFRDAAGNTASSTDNIIVDAAAPVGTLTITDADPTRTRTLTLALTASSDTEEIAYVLGAGAACPAYPNPAVWSDFAATDTYQLPNISAAYVLKACFRDTAGNVGTATDSITLDIDAPSAVDVQIAEGSPVNDRDVTLQLSADADVTHMSIANAGSLDCAGATYISYVSSYPWRLTDASGGKTVTVCFRDRAGNTASDSVEVVLDLDPPDSAAIAIAEGGIVTDTTVTLNLSAPADVTHIKVANGAGIDCSSGVTTPFTPTIAGWVLAGSNGMQYVSACFKDAAGNVAVAVTSTLVDVDPPTVSVTILNPDPTNDTELDLQLFASDDVMHMAIVEGESTDCPAWPDASSWEDYQSATTHEVQDGSGDYVIKVCFRDHAGHVTAGSDGVTVDIDPPTAIGIEVEEGTTVNRTDVTLLLTADDDVTHMSIKNATTLDCATANYVAYIPTYPWDLTAGSGDKTVSVCFRDEAGNTALDTVDVTVDLDNPDAATVTIEGGAIVLSSTVTLTLSAPADVTRIKIQNGTNIDCSSGVTTAFSPTISNWTLDDGDGSRSVSVCFKDAAGNTSSDTDSVIVDLTPPTGSVIINGSDPTPNRTLSLSLSASVDVEEMAFVLGANTDCPAYPNPALWEDFNQTGAMQLPNVSGQYVLKACFVDRAGRIGSAIDTVTLDVDAPTTGSVEVAEGSPINTISVTLQLAAPEDVNRMAIANAGSLDCETASYITFAPTYPWTLTAGTGTKSISVCFKDQAGNTGSDTTVVEVDLDAPDSATITISGGSTTQSSTVDLALSAPADVEYMKIANGSSIDCSSGVDTPFAGAVADWLLEPGDGTRWVSACFKDEAGNTVSKKDSIVVDGTAPTVAVSIGGPDPTNAVSGVSVSLSASSDVTLMRIVQSITELTPDCGVGTYEPYATTKSVNLSTDGTADYVGPSYVYVCFKDPAGNTTLGSDFVTVDLQEPTVAVSINSGDASTDSTLVSIRLTVGDGDATEMAVANGGSLDCGTATYQEFQRSFTWVLSDGDSTDKTVTVCVRDEAGNEGTGGDDIDLDTTPPGTPNLRLPSPGAITQDLKPTFAWHAAADPDHGSATITYEIAIDQVSSGLNAASGVTTSTSFTPASDLIDGEVYVWRVRASDELGNTSAWSTSWIVEIDATPPSGVGIDLKGFVVGASTYTKTPSVTVFLEGQGATEMMLSESGDFTGAEWQPFSMVTTFTLSSVEGSHTVYLCTRDEAGNRDGDCDGGTPVFDRIVYDATAPSGVSITLSGDYYTNNPVLTATINAAGAYQYMLFGDIVVPDPEWTELSGSTDVGVRLNITTLGLKQVMVKFRDQAQNESSTGVATAYFDNSGPLAGSIDVYGTEYNNVKYINSEVLSLELAAEDEHSGISKAHLSSMHGGWAETDQDEVIYQSFLLYTLTPPALQSSLVDGMYTVFVQYEDRAGNFSPAGNGRATADIYLDRVAPTNASVEVEVAGGGYYDGYYINRSTFTLNMYAEDATEYYLSGGIDDDSEYMFEWVDCELLSSRGALDRCRTVSNDPIELENVSFREPWGIQTLNLQFKDIAGNVTGGLSKPLFLDPFVPATCNVDYLGGFTFDGARYINDTTITLGASAEDMESGIDHLSVEYQHVDSGNSDTEELPYTDPVYFPVAYGDGVYKLNLDCIDKAGNSTDASQTTIVVDTIPPEAPSVALAGGMTGRYYLDNISASLNLQATGGIQYLVSGDVTTVNGLPPDRWNFCDYGSGGVQDCGEAFTVPIAFTNSSGHKNLFVRYRDAAHNETSDVQLQVFMDLNDPTLSVAQIVETPAYTNERGVQILLSAYDDESGLESVLLSNDGVNFTEFPYTSLVNWLLPDTDAQYTITALVTDRAGRESNTRTMNITLDRQPPTNRPSLSPSSWTGNADNFWLSISGTSQDDNAETYQVLGGPYLEWTDVDTFIDDERSYVTPVIDVELLQNNSQQFQIRMVDGAGNAGPVSFPVTVTEDSSTNLGEVFNGMSGYHHRFWGSSNGKIYDLDFIFMGPGWGINLWKYDPMRSSADSKIWDSYNDVYSYYAGDINDGFDIERNVAVYTLRRLNYNNRFDNFVLNTETDTVHQIYTNEVWQTMRTDGEYIVACRSADPGEYVLRIMEIGSWSDPPSGWRTYDLTISDGLCCNNTSTNWNVDCYSYDIHDGRVFWVTNDYTELGGDGWNDMYVYQIEEGTFHGSYYAGTPRKILEGSAELGIGNIEPVYPRFSFYHWNRPQVGQSRVFSDTYQLWGLKAFRDNVMWTSTNHEIYMTSIATGETTKLTDDMTVKRRLEYWGDLAMYLDTFNDEYVIRNLRNGQVIPMQMDQRPTLHFGQIFYYSDGSDDLRVFHAGDAKHIGDYNGTTPVRIYGDAVSTMRVLEGDYSLPLFFDIGQKYLIGMGGQEVDTICGHTIWDGSNGGDRRIDLISGSGGGCNGEADLLTMDAIDPGDTPSSTEGLAVDWITNGYNINSVARYGDRYAYAKEQTSGNNHALIYNIGGGEITASSAYDFEVLGMFQNLIFLTDSDNGYLRYYRPSTGYLGSKLNSLINEFDFAAGRGAYIRDSNDTIYTFYADYTSGGMGANTIVETVTTARHVAAFGRYVGVDTTTHAQAFYNVVDDQKMVLIKNSTPSYTVGTVSIGREYAAARGLITNYHTYMESRPQNGCLPVHYYTLSSSTGYNNNYRGYIGSECLEDLEQDWGTSCPTLVSKYQTCNYWELIADGYFYAVEEGEYEFDLCHRYRGYLTVDGRAVISNSSYTSWDSYDTGLIYLSKGWHRLTLRLADYSSSAYMQLKYRTPRMIAKHLDPQTIPAALLGHDRSTP